MKKIDVIYNLYGYIDEVSDNSIHFEQENDSLQINATIETDKKVRAYIKAPSNNSTVTDELTPVGGVYSCLADGEYMSKGTLYVGYELYDDTGYIERLEPLKIYIDSFVSLDGSNSDNVYVVTVTVGEVETVDFEQPATIENVGTKKDMVLNFKIPRGETGLKGEKGDKGDKGEDSNIENISISCTEFPYDASELDSITKYGMYYVEYGDNATYDGHCFMTVEGNYDEGWISQTLTLGQAVLRREYNYFLIDFEEGSWSEWEERSVTKKYVDNSLKAKAEKTEIPTKVSQLTDDITEHTYNSASTKPQSGKAVAEALAKLIDSTPENFDTIYKGIYKIPSLKIHTITNDKLYITQNVSEGYINKKGIKFGDFLYWSEYTGNIYSVYQKKIDTLYDANDNAFKDFDSGYQYEDIDSIDISNSQLIYIMDYKEDSEFPYEPNSFWLSGYYAMSKTDTFMYLGDIPFELDEEQGNNTPISENVSISGVDNVAGCRGFKILSCEETGITTGKYFLNSIEGLCVGDIYSVIFGSYYMDLGKIEAININEESVTVTNFKNEMNDNPNDNIFFIINKPFLGTEDIGQLASANGINNFAVLMGAHAGGKLTRAIGSFSRTGGVRSVAKGYGSIAEGAGVIATKNYQRVAGKYNIEDKEEKYLDIVGNGTGDNKRSNAYTLDEEGNAGFLGTISGKDLLINSSLEGVSIFGDTKMLKGDSASAYAFNNITLDGNEIYSSSKPIELNSVTDVSRDELIINDKLKVIRKVKKIVLGDNLKNTTNNSYQFNQQTDKDSNGNKYLKKSFFVDLATAVDVNGNPILTEDEKEKLKNGKIVYTYTVLCTHFPYLDRFPDSKAYFNIGVQRPTEFRVFFYDENAVDIRKSVLTNRCYTKEEIQTKINSGELSGYDIRTLPMVLYFTLIEPTEEELYGDYSEEWNSFVEKYKSNSEIVVNGQLVAQNSELSEDCILSSQVNYLPISKYVDNSINKAIGDIETSLENIITKYGLGGEVV